MSSSEPSRSEQPALAEMLTAECDRLRKPLSRRIPYAYRSVLEVDDVLQQACVDAFRSYDRVRISDRRAFAAWFETIARRTLINAVRSLKSLKRGGDRAPVVVHDPTRSLRLLLSELFAHSVTASRQAMASESLNLLRDAVRRLPEHYRSVVEQYDLQQRPIEQVAQSLGKTVGATYMIRNRAHRLLVEMLGSTATR